jgi:hypothetical protein
MMSICYAMRNCICAKRGFKITLKLNLDFMQNRAYNSEKKLFRVAQKTTFLKTMVKMKG